MSNGNEIFGCDLLGDPINPGNSIGALGDRFLFPPFTTLDARNGEWLNRKRAWIGTGIKSEVGRDTKVYTIAENDYMPMSNSGDGEGISIFDPVLCECLYLWFCKPGGQVVDPFAGGSVRGIVANALGLKYWGCDLRPEQIEANNQQRHLCANPDVPLDWVCGDSIETLPDAPEADFVFSCPPYGDLEKYSDHEKDLSNMEWHTFLAAYRRVIFKACLRLKDDSFACFVVGDYRDKKGIYKNFESETITAFLLAGMLLYNRAVLVTPVGTAAARATKQFDASRKLCKTHQDVLIFVKGDPRKATAKCKAKEKLCTN